MTRRFIQHSILAAALSVLCAQVVFAQNATEAPAASQADAAPSKEVKASFDRALNAENNWYFSWGFSRQQYAPSDIHVSQPGLGNDFTVHQAAASDFPANFQDTISSTLKLELTNMVADVENAQMASLITAFQMKQIAMQASYSMAAKISEMTIMSYI